MRCRFFPFIAYLLVYRQFDSSTNRDVELSIVCFDDSLYWQQIVLTINCYDNKLYRQQIVQTISCTNNDLSYNKIVKTIVSSNYCFYNSLLRPKSLSMPYLFGLFAHRLALPCKVGSEKILPHKEGYLKRIDENKTPCGGDFSLHSQGLTLQGIGLSMYLCPIRIRLQALGLC